MTASRFLFATQQRNTCFNLGQLTQRIAIVSARPNFHTVGFASTNRQYHQFNCAIHGSQQQSNQLLVASQTSSNLQRATMASSTGSKMLTLETMNPNVIKMEYAVRGPLVIRAAEIEKEMQQVSRKDDRSILVSWDRNLPKTSFY